MFKPARMTRLLVGGHTDRMEEVIEALHQEGVLHLEDYQDPTGTTRIGTPLEAGDVVSDLLVRVRGLMKVLDVSGFEPKTLATDDPAHLVEEAETAILPEVEALAGVRAQCAALEADKAQLEPLAPLDVDLGSLSGLTAVRVFLGTVRQSPQSALAASGMAHEVHTAQTRVGAIVLVLVRPEDAAAAERLLLDVGYQALPVPAGVQGTPSEALGAIEATLAETRRILGEAEAAVAALRQKWGRKLTSLEAFLSGEAEKTLVPLQFGVTQSTFHVEGWVPRNRVNRIQNVLAARFGDGLYVEDVGDAPRGSHGHGHGQDHDGHHEVAVEDEAPTKLENRGPAQKYEFMLGLLALPRYRELDPTKLIALFFPLFFGLMVGDAVIGLLIMGVAWYLRDHRVFGIGGDGIAKPMLWGGLVAVLVGLLVFGEGLGLHFVLSDDALEEGEHSWESVLGFEFPTEGFIHKVDNAHDAMADHGTEVVDHTTVGDATHSTATDGGTMAPHAGEVEQETGLLTPHGGAHLTVNGWFNLGYYSKIHDVQPLLVWSVLIGLAHILLAFLLGVRNVAVGHGIKLAIQEKVSWLLIMASIGAIAVGSMGGDTTVLWLGVAVLVLGVVLLWLGVANTLGGGNMAMGFIAILEIPGLAGNILSYTRLAAIGASKAGMAIAFATIGFELIGGVAGLAIYLVASLLITVLAILAGFLQSLRLQFVEFFGKFYEGGGRPYAPFGSRRPPSTP